MEPDQVGLEVKSPSEKSSCKVWANVWQKHKLASKRNDIYFIFRIAIRLTVNTGYKNYALSKHLIKYKGIGYPGTKESEIK